ncbi:MAG: beta-1,6-galactofuranosyltransferase [Streptococcaceae bacterium]|jgi:hypothetical protein|nr:beta-1,6-galactofuranosyltransferase [Streptococcaceae bacterium]
MTYWITCPAENEWNAATKSGIIISQDAAKSASEIGFRVLHYPRLYAGTLREMPWQERMDYLEAITAPVMPGDVVVIQYPIWTNYVRWENEFFDYFVNNKKGVKLAALVWDVLSWVHDDRERDYSGDWSLSMLNKFDVVIAANEKMARRMHEEGAVKGPFLAMGISDLRYAGAIQEKKFLKRLYYVATGINPNMLEDYKAQTEMVLIGPHGDLGKIAEKFQLLGAMKSVEIPRVFEGGFGLVDYGRDAHYKGMLRYGEYNNPMKLSMYLAAGLPPVVLEKSAHAAWIREKGLGLVLSNLTELDLALSKLTEEDYARFLTNMAPYSRAVRQGWFVKHTLMEAIRYLKLGFADKLVRFDGEAARFSWIQGEKK